jgi:hypothetical protein
MDPLRVKWSVFEGFGFGCPEAIVGNTAIIRISFSLVSLLIFKYKENIGLPYSQEKL